MVARWEWTLTHLLFNDIRTNEKFDGFKKEYVTVFCFSAGEKWMIFYVVRFMWMLEHRCFRKKIYHEILPSFERWWPDENEHPPIQIFQPNEWHTYYLTTLGPMRNLTAMNRKTSLLTMRNTAQHCHMLVARWEWTPPPIQIIQTNEWHTYYLTTLGPMRNLTALKRKTSQFFVFLLLLSKYCRFPRVHF